MSKHIDTLGEILGNHVVMHTSQLARLIRRWAVSELPEKWHSEDIPCAGKCKCFWKLRNETIDAAKAALEDRK